MAHRFSKGLLSVFVYFTFFGANSFAGHHPFQPGAAGPKNFPNLLAPVTYYGGPVLSHAKVHLVFWGPGVENDTQVKLGNFYRDLVDSTYMDQLSEYATNINAVDGRKGSNQQIGRGSMGATTTIRPFNTSNRLTQADLEHELEAQILAGGLPAPDADSLYMIHFPAGFRISISFGESCSSWYADHEYYASPTFGNVYYAVFPCESSNSNNFSMLTYAASHELGEAISDPASPLQDQPMVFPTGWIRSDGQEIGDLCTGTGSYLQTSTARYSLNSLWLNSKRGCNTATFTH